jgi:DNA-binding MarR family transcriptional regulator
MPAAGEDELAETGRTVEVVEAVEATVATEAAEAPGTAGTTATTGTRWLTADQLAAWRAFMHLAQQLPSALECQLQRDSRLSFLEYYVLAILSEQPEHRMRMSALASQANAELSRLSHLVSRLEKRGILRRAPDPDDGRYTHVVLTEAGHAYLVEAAPGHVARVRELFVEALDPEELAVMHRSAEKVVARIGDTSERGGKAAGARTAADRC